MDVFGIHSRAHYKSLVPWVSLTGNSIVETPIRHQTRDIRYIKGRVEDVDFDSKTCRCTPAVGKLDNAIPGEFTLSFDHLILAPGCTNNTFGTPGVAEHAFFVRTASDAKAIQAHIRNCFETASIPGTTTEQSKPRSESSFGNLHRWQDERYANTTN